MKATKHRERIEALIADDAFLDDIPEGLEFYDIRRQSLKKHDDELEISVSQVCQKCQSIMYL